MIDIIEKKISQYKILRLLISYEMVTFVYGIFLTLYELHFTQEIVASLHPFLIFWAVCVAGYNIIIKKQIKNWYAFVPMCLFCASILLSSVTNFEAGIGNNIKICVLTILPFFVFYPLCFQKSAKKRRKSLVLVLLGPSVVIFVAAVTALVMYVIRFEANIIFMGTKHLIGIRLYDLMDPTSGLLVCGLYKDTNYAAVYTMIFAVYSILLYHSCNDNIFVHNWKNQLGKIYAIINFMVQICYFPLANSRGAWLSCAVAIFIVCFILVYYKILNKNWVQKIVISIVSACMCTGLVIGGILCLRMIESKVSLGLQVKENKAVLILEKPVISEFVCEDNEKITIMWNAVEGAIEYEVYCSENDIEYDKLDTTTELSYTNTPVKNSKVYYYKIKALGEDAESLYSDIVEIEIKSESLEEKELVQILGKPEISYSIQNENDKPIIMWNAVEGATEYEVYRSENDVDYEKLDITTELSYTNTSAQNGKVYYYKVKALGEGVESLDSDTIQVTMSPASLEELQDSTDMEIDNFQKKNVVFGSGRLQIWKEVPELLVKKPILGTGAGNYAYYAQKYEVAQDKLAMGSGIHNSYLDVLLSYGIVGTVMFCIFMLTCCLKIFKNITKRPKMEITYYLMLFEFIFISCQAILLSNIFVNITAVYYVIMIVLGYIVSEEK